MLKVLFVIPSFPLPAHSGGAIATFETLRSVAGRCNLHVLTPSPQTNPELNLVALTDALPGVTVHSYEARDQQLPKFEMYTTAALTTVTGKPYWALSWRNRDLRLAVQRLCSQYHFDVVHAEWLQTAVSIWDLRIPLLIRTLDVHFLGMLDWSKSIAPSDKLRRAFWQRQAERFRRFEAHVLSRASLVVCLSKEDEAALREQGVTNIETIPPPRALAPDRATTRRESKERCVALFVGRLDMPVNREAFFLFVDQIWPTIPERLKARCSVIFAGGFPDQELRTRAATDAIELRAPLSDSQANELFDRADLFFSPVQSGTGIKIKTIEALAQGKAMVGFINAFRGVPVTSGCEALVADSASEFATMMEQLVANPTLREELGKNAQRLIQTNFDPAVLGTRLLEVYEQVTNNARTRNQARTA